MRATSMIAEFVAKSRWEDCPAEAVDAARRAILDSLGVMLAGSVEPAGNGGMTINVTVQGGGAEGLVRSDAQIAQALARAVGLGARRL